MQPSVLSRKELDGSRWVAAEFTCADFFASLLSHDDEYCGSSSSLLSGKPPAFLFSVWVPLCNSGCV